jgi:hypothetical protein
MACQPADHLLIQHVGRQDEDQDAAVLQQGQRALVEQLFQTGAALAFIAQVAAGVPCEIAIGRVEPQEAEGLPRDHGVHQVTVDAVIDQQPGVGGPLLIELDGIGAGQLRPEGMGGFGDGNAFASAGITNAHGPIAGRERAEGSFEGGFVGRVVPVLGEIPSEPGEHECHGKSPVWRG